jgi:hypothetical protein
MRSASSCGTASANACDSRLQPPLEMLDDVFGDERQALLRADDGLKLRPLTLELFFAFDFLPFGHLLERGVDRRPLHLLQRQLRQAALVVDGHRRPIFDRTLDVVDADVVAENGARVGVGRLDGGLRKADERGVGQRVAHVPGEAIDEVILAAVRFVGDDDDVAPLREHGMPVALLFGQEFLDGGKDHAARRHGEPGTQIGAVGGLHRRLAQEVLAAREGAEELIVQVIAIGEDDDRGVRHQRLADHTPGIESHGQALARALRMPDHADAPVAWTTTGALSRLVATARLRDPIGRLLEARCPQRLGHSDVHGMELMVTSHLLHGGSATRVLEDNEMPHEVE